MSVLFPTPVPPFADLDPEPPTEPSGGPFRWLRRLLLGAVGLLLGTAAAVLATYLYFDRDLPSVESLRTYRPPQVSKVTCEDGSVCAEYFRERRTNVDTRLLPAHVRFAFLAAEDAEFYTHEGLDYLGMGRAVLKALLPGGHMTGASTITQQACRNLLLTQERKLSRKIREWILTPRMEKALSKDQILDLYLNQIYFGQGRYGVEEAALYYFGKHAYELSVGEAASLAGTVQSPERGNPVSNILRAKKRQTYVLHQLVKHNFLRESEVAPWIDRPIELAPRPPAPVGPYYIEEMRRLLVSRYGDEALLSGGLRVQIAMNPKLQALADDSVRAGLEALDHKMGYSGPLGKLTPARFAELRPLIAQRLAESGRRPHEGQLVPDLTRLASMAQEPAGAADSAEAETEGEGEEAESVDMKRLRALPVEPLKPGLRLGAYVAVVDDNRRFASLDLVGRTARVDFATLTWARPRGVGKWTAPPTHISDVLHEGDLVRVRVLTVPAGNAPAEVTLDQVPEVQGALTVIDPATRHVVALVGGYDFERSSFNRATQAKRQPGSSFKPFLYAAALASQKFTTVSVLNDAPEAIRDPWTGKTWKPQNFEKNGYDGPMTLRQAITHSKNTISVRLMEALTPQVVTEFAAKAGIHSPMPQNLTLALGTGEVSQLEIANAYATLASLGRYADPILLMKVSDAQGAVLEEHQASFTEAIPPAVAYLATSLMRSVVEQGTGIAVRELARPAAGKTGTASEYRDAWFSGYTPDFVTSAWAGFDNHQPLGKADTGTGASAALPMWLSFMKQAEDGRDVRDFEVPPGIDMVRIDPQTGLLAGAAVPGRLEPFLKGTAPTQETTHGQVRQDQYYLEDEGRSGL
jgi:penicillin-binding protein 1A